MKQVPWLRLIILLATLTVIGTFTLWYEFEHKPTTEIKQENEKKILPLADKNIASVEITGKKNRFIIICAETENKNLCQADKNAKWEIQFPKKLTADSNKLRSILSALKGLDAVEKIDLSKESSLKKKALLKSYHLDEESLKNDKRNEITLKLEDGNTYSIFLGQKHPITFQYFLLLKSNDNLDTNTVYLVSAAIEKHFEQTLTFWRDKKIFDFQSNQIQSFTLLFDKDSFQGNQKSNRWILDSFKSSTLKNIEGDAELIERYLSSLSYLNTREFHPDTILKGKNKTATLTLNFEKNKKITIQVFREPQKSSNKRFIKASNRNLIFELAETDDFRFRKNLNDFREKIIFKNSDISSIQSIRFQGGPFTAPFEITKQESEDHWVSSKKLENKHIQVDGQKASDFLNYLSSKNAVVDFIPMAQFSRLKAPKDHWELHLLGEKPLYKFLIWKKENNYYAKLLFHDKATHPNLKRTEFIKFSDLFPSKNPWKFNPKNEINK